MRVVTASGLTTMQQYEQISQRLMEFPQVTGAAAAGDLSGFSLAAGTQIDAILGMDFLNCTVFQISNGKPQFRNRNHLERNLRGQSYPVTTIRKCPYIAVGLPVLADRQFLIDTGWVSYCGITKDYADRLIRTHDALLLEEIPTLDASGLRQKKVYVIREIEVFGITVRDVPAEESDVNLIGLGLMRHFDFSIDFENAVAYVLPSSRSVVSLDLDASGLRTVFQPDRGLIVRRIVPDSPAGKNNIQTGVQLLEIDGRITSELSYLEIRHLLSQVGKTIPIKVKSGDQVRNIQLPLRRNFEYPPKWKPRSTNADDFLKSLKNEAKP